MDPLSLAPLPLLAASALAALRPGRRPGAIPTVAEGAALAALALAAAGALWLVLIGPSGLSLGSGPTLLALRLDPVSATMGLLVAFVGWVVVRYSRRYLDGEAREGRFHALMMFTLAAVLLLVQAGSLAVLVAAFVATGLGLRHLLLFYPERAEARRAAAKFTLVWGAGNAAVILAAVLLWSAFGTADLAAIATAAGEGLPLAAQAAVALMVLAAALKTAAIPLHGWLTEVMEAPTPVSALLHAGIVNAGGFLLIRMAEVVQASPGAMAALVMIGGLTALFGAVVMLTSRPSRPRWPGRPWRRWALCCCNAALAFGRWRCCTSWHIRSTRRMPSCLRAVRCGPWRRCGGRGRWPCRVWGQWRVPS